MAAAVLGLVGSLMSASAQSSAARQQAEYQNQIARYNAQQAENQAAYARQAAAAEESRFRRQSAKELGAIRAQYGAAGVEIEGSPLDVLQESATMAELDALTIRHRGDVQAQGYLNTAALDRHKGQSALASGRATASSARTLGILRGVTSFVGNGGFGLTRTG